MRPQALLLSLILSAGCAGGVQFDSDTGDNDTDTADTDSGDTDSGDTDSGDTDSGDTDSGDTASGSTCADDTNEPDDTLGDATPLAPTVTVTGQACSGDSDLFSLAVGDGCTVDAHLDFTHATGDLELYLLDDDGFDVDSSESSSDDEDISYENDGAATTLYLEVLGYAGDEAPYSLSWTTTCPEPCADDVHEENDDAGSATTLTTAAALEGQVCRFDQDWFAVTAAQGCGVEVSVTFAHADGDLDVSLRDGAGVVDSSAGTSGVETVAYNNRAGSQAKPLFVVVYGYSGAQNDYTVTLVEDCDVCDDDPADDNAGNDTSGTATALAAGADFDGTVCAADVDWFAVAGEDAGSCLVEATLDVGAGDLDLRLVDAAGTAFASSIGTTGDESISFRLAPTATAAFLQVVGKGGEEGDYTLSYTVDCGPCTDAAEENDVDDDAYALTAPFEGRACGDDDWFVFTAAAGCEGRVEVTFDTAAADLDLWLYDELDAADWLDRAVSDESPEILYYDNTLATGQAYYVQVERYEGGEATYTIEVIEDCTVCVDDPGTDDVAGGATTLAEGVPAAAEICEDDEDWYVLTVADGCSADVLIDFDHGFGDLEAALYSSALTVLQYSERGVDDEAVSYVNDVGTGATEQAYVVVYGYLDADNEYTISFTEVCECTDDTANQTFATALEVGPSSETPDQMLCATPSGDDWDGEDWFKFKAPADCTSFAWITFFATWGDLDLVLFDADGDELDYSGSTLEDIEIVAHETGSTEETLYLQVLGYLDPGDPGNAYSLEVWSDCE